jgi:hypothetical protein
VSSQFLVIFIDFVFYYRAYIWNFEIGVKGVIRHVPRCVSNGSKYFGLTALHDCYVGLASTSPVRYNIRLLLA